MRISGPRDGVAKPIQSTIVYMVTQPTFSTHPEMASDSALLATTTPSSFTVQVTYRLSRA
jgi:hypothetical protein